MTGQSLLFVSTLILGLVGVARGAQQALRGPAATACRLDDKESESWETLLSTERLDAWICSLAGSLMVGLSGVFPLLVIPLETGAALRSEAGAQRLKQLLSFALGGLLGNVFLHLLPEAWAYTCSATTGGEGQSLQQQQLLGLWVIVGFLTFLGLEKMFLDSREKDRPSQISGYLNLLANTIDNFTHGLAVAASFLVSKKIGLLTTMAILLHEIPHEVRAPGLPARGHGGHGGQRTPFSAALTEWGLCARPCAQSRGYKVGGSWAARPGDGQVTPPALPSPDPSSASEPTPSIGSKTKKTTTSAQFRQRQPRAGHRRYRGRMGSDRKSIHRISGTDGHRMGGGRPGTGRTGEGAALQRPGRWNLLDAGTWGGGGPDGAKLCPGIEGGSCLVPLLQGCPRH
uniref:Zinc transporter ZIP13 n=1 Tax=Monodelphis domestica TaxID=13616 RepID=A0A5F8H1J5_MONDO